MSSAGWLQFLALVALVVASPRVPGRYMARVYGHDDRPAPGDRFFGAIERPIYRLCGVDPRSEQRWTTYACSLLGFSLVSFLVLYAILRVQGSLPLNSVDLPGVGEHLSFNTAVSFMTNTNWQSYGGETTLSHLSQMGLTVQNFVSAAGMAVMAALIRGLARRRASTLGNFWVAEERALDVEDVLELVDDHTSGRDLGFLVEKGVNVLELNLALDDSGSVSSQTRCGT